MRPPYHSETLETRCTNLTYFDLNPSIVFFFFLHYVFVCISSWLQVHKCSIVKWTFKILFSCLTQSSVEQRKTPRQTRHQRWEDWWRRVRSWGTCHKSRSFPMKK